jgi:helicase
MEREAEILVPQKHGADYEFFLAELKTASLLHDWIEELPEEDTLKKYGAYPGDVASKVETARWLLYATEEVARIFQKEATKPVTQLAARVQHGARAELLPLLDLRGVGRWRARQLWKAGYRSKESLTSASFSQLTQVQGIGPVLATSIMKELGRDPALEPPAEPEPKKGQQTLWE